MYYMYNVRIHVCWSAEFCMKHSTRVYMYMYMYLLLPFPSVAVMLTLVLIVYSLLPVLSLHVPMLCNRLKLEPCGEEFVDRQSVHICFSPLVFLDWVLCDLWFSVLILICYVLTLRFDIFDVVCYILWGYLFPKDFDILINSSRINVIFKVTCTGIQPRKSIGTKGH